MGRKGEKRATDKAIREEERRREWNRGGAQSPLAMRGKALR